MGNTFTANTNSTSETDNHIYKESILNKDEFELIDLFKIEWYALLDKWNNGTIKGKDFQKTSIILRFLKTKNKEDKYKDLRNVYDDMIDQWNSGNIRVSDLNKVTRRL